MNPALALDPGELAEVRAILAAHLPDGVTAGVFGSRAGGRPKPWSDLDLMLEGETPLPLSLLAALAEAFDESTLPWKVNLVDRRAVTSEFGAIIDAGRVELG